MTYKFKSAYQPHERHITKLDEVSLTHQALSAECDINRIMQRFERTGVLEHRNRFEGAYGDFTDAPGDYQESMNAVLAAEEMFSTLPAKIRRRFHNDPGAFLDYVSNPDNQDEMISLGLATRAPNEVLDDPATPTPQKSQRTSEPSKNEPPAPSNPAGE
jgi:phage internal scaffolding protein